MGWRRAQAGLCEEHARQALTASVPMVLSIWETQLSWKNHVINSVSSMNYLYIHSIHRNTLQHYVRTLLLVYVAEAEVP